jgi:hypothetical protein
LKLLRVAGIYSNVDFRLGHTSYDNSAVSYNHFGSFLHFASTSGSVGGQWFPGCQATRGHPAAVLSEIHDADADAYRLTIKSY